MNIFMHKDKMITVIIPVYNGAKYITRVVNSVEKNGYQFLEIIIVNDASTDNTAEVVKRLTNTDKRIILINLDSNSGIGHARNVGIDAAHGEWVTFCDADDLVNPLIYESMMTAAKKYKTDLICCDHSNIINGEIVYKRPNTDKHYRCCDRREALRCLYDGKIIAWGVWDKLFKKEILDKGVRFPDEKLRAQDVIFLLDYVLKCKTVCYAGLGYYYHEDNNAESYTKRKWGKPNFGLTIMYRKIYNAIKREKLNDCLENAGERYFENLLSTYIRSRRLKYEEADSFRKEMKEHFTEIKENRKLKLIYKVDIFICIYFPKIGDAINVWYK